MQPLVAAVSARHAVGDTIVPNLFQSVAQTLVAVGLLLIKVDRRRRPQPTALWFELVALAMIKAPRIDYRLSGPVPRRVV